MRAVALIAQREDRDIIKGISSNLILTAKLLLQQCERAHTVEKKN